MAKPDVKVQEAKDCKNFYARNGENILQLETMAYSLVNDLFDNYNLSNKSYRDICELIGNTTIANDMQKIVRSLQNELLTQVKRKATFGGLFNL